jgi:SAM-dependent methyltransferase
MGRRVSAKEQRQAERADKHALYQESVQSPEQEIELIEQIFREGGRPPPRSLREDFCGTALLCAAWVQSHGERQAMGVDLDPVPLEYGKQHHLAKIGRAAERVQLLCTNVMEVSAPEVDALVALNFSYCAIRERRTMLRYFETVRRSLKPGGGFIFDVYGGTDAQTECEEKTVHDDFTYVWEQGVFDAVNAGAERHISFHFPDGSKLDRAFSYEWRVWTMPELRDILADAGFAKSSVYWEGANPKGGGNGEFTPVSRADNEQAWIAYVVGWK